MSGRSQWPVLSYPGKRPVEELRQEATRGRLVDVVPESTDLCLIRGDNLEVLRCLRDDPTVRGQVDLVYIDPPYATKRRFSSSRAEDAYSDLAEGAEYLDALRERLVALHQLLSESGSFYLHVDIRAAAYLRVICDEIFGPGRLLNEIIWKRTATTKAQSGTWSKVHDVILFYSKGPQYYFVPQRGERRPDVEATYRLEDARGLYKLENFAGAGQGPARYFGGERGWIEPAPGKHWIWSQERIDSALADTPPRLAFSQRGTPKAKRYLHEVQQPPLGSIWADLVFGAGAGERVDYPTQKPIALLERIIEASCPPNGMVLDCYGGSGTTLLAAAACGRRAITIDAGELAAQTIRRRCEGRGLRLHERRLVSDGQPGASNRRSGS